MEFVRSSAYGRDKGFSSSRVRTLRHLSAIVLCACLCLSPLKAFGDIRFEEVAISSGIDRVGLSWGAAWGDFNGDYWPDLWANNHFAEPNLYLNNGDGTFTDLMPSILSSPTDLKRDAHGAAWGDIDNDGDADLVELTGLQTSASNSRNSLYINNSFLTLTEAAASFQIETPIQRGRGPQLVDWDNDGFLDLVLTTAPDATNSFLSTIYRQTANGFEDASGETGFSCPRHAEFAALSDLTGDGVMDIICGGFTFPQKIYDPSVIPFNDVTWISPQISGVLDAAIADFNNDLLPDMFLTRILGERSNVALLGSNELGAVLVVNASSPKGFEFRSQGELLIDMSIGGGTLPIFVGAAGWRLASTDRITLSSSDTSTWGIQDHTTGERGLYIGYNTTTQTWRFFLSAPGWRRLLGRFTSENPISDPVTLRFTPQPARPPVLLENQGGRFEDRSSEAGINIPVYCSTSAWGDFDNDMDVDLYLVCEHSPKDLPNILYENQGDGTFVAVPNAGGADGASAGGLSRNVAVADYDVDGFLDLFVQQGRDEGPTRPWGPICCGPDLLFRNVGRENGNLNNWIQLDLVGTVSNRDGVGASVIATAGSIQQLREQNGGMQHGQQRHQRIHFGLGPHESVDLSIRWPSGLVDNHLGVDAGRLYLAHEGGDIEAVTLEARRALVRVGDVDVVEADGAAEFVVTLSRASTETIEVQYTTVDGTAIAGQDYTPLNGTLTFPPGETRQTISIPILDDTEPEGIETFTLELTDVVSGNGTIRRGVGTGTILDDDNSGNDCGEPTFFPSIDKAAFLWKDCTTGQWRLQVAAGGDPAGAVYTGRILADTFFDTAAGNDIESHDTLTLGADTIGFTLKVWNQGIDGIDFSYPSGTSACFELDTPTDVPVRVGPQALPQQVPLDLETLLVCGAIPDPEITVTDATAVEGDGAVAEFTVSLSEESTETIEVSYTTVDGTALAGADYTAVSGTLTFLAGETTQTIAVPILNDTDLEGPETFTLELTGIVSGNATIADASGTGTIEDAPAPGPGITVTDATAVEGDGAIAEFTVSLSEESTETIEVSYTTVDGTALAGADYTAVSGTLTFLAGETTQTIAVPILNDTDLEGPETFTLELTGIVSGNATIADASGTGTIEDAPAPGPGITVTDATAVEGDGAIAEFTVSLSEESTETIEVSYTTVDGTALAGADYTAVSGTLTFLAGETTQTIAVPILNDTDLEGPETFTLELTGIVSGNATIADASGTGTIEDAPAPGPGITVTDATAVEGDGAIAEFTVSLSEESTETIEVSYTTVDGTALAGQDYTTVSGTLTFLAGETTQTIAVPILNDTDLEGPETFTLELTGIVSGNATIADASGTGTIEDAPAPGPGITVTDATAVEGDGVVAEFTVSLSEESTETIEVSYTTVDGTALAGADYTAVSGTLTFLAGETTQTIAVPILNDTDLEGPETFTLELTGIVSGNATIADASGTGTIEDAPAPGPGITVTDATAVEGDGVVAEFIVSLSEESTETIEVSYTTVDGTALAGADYTAVSGTLTFLAGETTQTIAVPILNDTTWKAQRPSRSS
jgi:hypothetical protein